MVQDFVATPGLFHKRQNKMDKWNGRCKRMTIRGRRRRRKGRRRMRRQEGKRTRGNFDRLKKGLLRKRNLGYKQAS